VKLAHGSAASTAATSSRATAPSCSQCHQYFTSGFCADILLAKKLQTQTVSTEKLLKTLSYEKAASNMLVKLTPVLPALLPLF